MHRARKGLEVWFASDVVEITCASARLNLSKKDHAAMIGKSHYHLLCMCHT